MATPKGKRRKSRSQASSADFIRQNVADAVASGLRPKKRRKLTLLQKAQRKVFKSSVAFLKRKGLIRRDVDARKVKSTSSLRKTIRQNKALINKQATAYTLPANFPPQALATLKKAGYKVRGGKLILPKGQYFRAPGKKRAAKQPVSGVYQKGVGKRQGGEIVSIPLGPDFETQIRYAFSNLKEGEWIGFSIEGHNSYNIYQSAQGMIGDLMRYKFMEGGAGITHITIFRTKKPDEYLARRTADRAKAEKRYAANRKIKRQARRKVAESGLRVTRGR